MTPQSVVLLATYNRWMNQRLYDACAQLDEAALVADRGAFFGSILSTLNHIAVADTIWLHRMAAHRANFACLQGLEGLPHPSSLRETLAGDLGSLRTYRTSLDDLISRWVAEIKPEHLSSSLRYRNMAGVENSKALGDLLLHFFNHQTHHRGQVSTLLFQAGVDVGVTDLITLVPHCEA